MVILAGGLGTRLRPVLRDRPKGLARIGSEAFLEIQIRLLRRQGFRQFVLCIGHRAHQIQAALADGRSLGVCIDYSVEQGGLLGTAGALKQAERWFAPRALVLNGDTYFNIDYARFVRSHDRQRRRFRDVVASLAIGRAEGQSKVKSPKSKVGTPERLKYGAIQFDRGSRLVTCFEEKTDVLSNVPGWFNGGAYVLEHDILEYTSIGRPCSLEREVFPAFWPPESTSSLERQESPFLTSVRRTGWSVFGTSISRTPK